ncbi:MAG TPA: response regulator transcription factor [Pyrinomonadaceae bacterium]|jgi:DNA-binding NarL/FixJ family response regulator
MMVFIADDSDPVRERLIALLSEIEGAEVIGQARNHDEAVEGIRSLKPHVVILDIQMPGGSGIDVLKNIKQDSRPPVVLMLTNHASPQYRKKCMEWGADFFLDKSREFESLASIFSGLIKQYTSGGAGAAGPASV